MTTAIINTFAPHNAEVVGRAFSDERVVRVTEYLDGFVPNAYRWKAAGRCLVHARAESGEITTTVGEYDRKRSGGKGADVVGLSAKGGRLFSW